MFARPGSSASAAAGALLALLATAGCLYKFTGGGLPGNVKTVAVLPFDNRTGEPLLTQEVSEAIRQAAEGRLGLRAAPEADADAVVRGEIVRYEPAEPLAYQSGQTQGQVNVTRRQVLITINVEIVDQRAGKTLWRGSSLSVNGEYDPPQEAEGRRIAIQKLVTSFIEGAQSQW